MISKTSGREDAVTQAFQEILFHEALLNQKTEAIIPLCGADRYANADSIFRLGDMFLLVESKSAQRNIRDEAKKDSACNLCQALQNDTQAQIWHGNCHYIMWARKRKGGLSLSYSIYQNAVCNITILPLCQGLNSSSGFIYNKAGKLARDLIQVNAGLCKPDFFLYLNWLFNVRSGVAFDDGLPITLYATSLAGGITSKSFDSLAELSQWAAPALAEIFRPNNLKLRKP